MIKKAKILVPAVCLILGLLSPVLVQAQGGLTISDSSAKASFPLQLNFNLSAESDTDIDDIRLHYTVEREGFAQVTSEVYIEFEPDTAVDAEWSWDMRRTGGLPPGSAITYWWTVTDISGAKVETSLETVHFNDNRYLWLQLTEGMVTIYWYEGEFSLATELMAAAQQALARLAEDSGAQLEKPAKIYIYASTRDLQGAMIFPQEWTGGAAFTEYGIIVLGINQGNIDWGKGAISHELAHLVVHQMTLNPYIGLPTWLSEGLATYNEGALEQQLARYLERAVTNDGLISVRSLSSPFSAHAEESYLSYGQSYSLVEFLVTTYGQNKMLELLTTFKQGSSYDGALEKVYGFDMDKLYTLWRDFIVKRYQEGGAGG
ncbi:MAG: peptidase MA family metallohydrolase [Dehalococcoidales bacterium]|nr:peptidase MA family metallohydrolase [Dehalococcoidales bacterium]MDP7525367.1 peptidase MA family metallohydrolase [Dehalococcoidales bacterium]